jgi:hypothetical protein
MTPKEKALKLHIKFYEKIPTLPDEGQMEYESAKQCALIAVDECLHTCVESMLYYWEEVKQEIEKL